MYKSFKIIILTILVIFMCTYITYSVEPGDAPIQNTAPTASPVSEEPAEPSPTPSPIQPEPSQPEQTQSESAPEAIDEAQIKAASSFNNEVAAIVTKRLNAFYKNGGKGTIGIFIKELNTGYEYAYNAEKTNPDNPTEGYFNTASTCKLLSAAVMYHMNECGELELDRTYRDEITKQQYKLSKLLPKMISHSVNGYFNITLRQLGSKQINQVLAKLGLKYSVVYSEIMPAEYSSVKNNIKRYGISRSPRTTPRDLGCVLELLYAEKTFGLDNSKLLMKSLLDNIYSNRLPAGVGYKSPVAHKTGTSAGEGVYNDAGIILLDGNPYIMVVMSKGSTSSVQPLYRTIVREVYDYMKKRTDTQPSISPEAFDPFSISASLV